MVILKVNTKEIPKKYIHKRKWEENLKKYTTKNKLNTKESSNAGNEELKGRRHTEK